MIAKVKTINLLKELHYVVQTDTGQHYQLAFNQDQSDWLLDFNARHSRNQ